MNDYYFSIDEPLKINEKIICAFYVYNIRKARGFFFITSNNNNLSLFYSLITGKQFTELLKKTVPSNMKNTSLIDINFKELKEYNKEYNKRFLHQVKIWDKSFVIKTLDKMKKDDIYNAKNYITGLDGYSVELKLDKGNKFFYSYYQATDKDYFYVIDFINYILDIAKIDKNYRFFKSEY